MLSALSRLQALRAYYPDYSDYYHPTKWGGFIFVQNKRCAHTPILRECTNPALILPCYKQVFFVVKNNEM